MNNFKKQFDRLSRYVALGSGIVALNNYVDQLKGEDVATKIETLKNIVNKDKERVLSLVEKIKDDKNTSAMDNIKAILAQEGENNKLLEHQGSKILTLLKELKVDLKVKEGSTEVSTEVSSKLRELISDLGYKFNEFSNTTKEQEKLSSELGKIIDSITSGKSGTSSNYINNFSDSFLQYKEYLSHLSTQQVGALGHLILLTVILLCLVSILFIFYGDLLIVKLKLESKYPRLAVFIRLRRKFQHFYLWCDICAITISVLMLMYVNLFVFFH